MRNILVIIILLICNLAFAQPPKVKESKMLDFVSKKGVIMKFEDFNLPKIKSAYGNCEVKIRKIVSGEIAKYFLQISKKGKYNTVTSSIAYEDIIEIEKALTALKIQATKDISTRADYLENKFISDDEFLLGYYVSKNKITWYMKLDTGNDGTVFLKSDEVIANALKTGREKITLLKQE
ncbi:hypothetical protein H2O64_20965 [Kordia sp. YSTF-M3]|uniref:Uncharacterized protein n=1 Tax=Kordia aestuariivivens TaxID=2759037 RepID=A0ABR7QF00_9FLAO|nr:hypothetical protein [Kordia aestuariivivens]MBC8757154.1 hypothetical protein [Kordia aestuariivivens]